MDPFLDVIVNRLDELGEFDLYRCHCRTWPLDVLVVFDLSMCSVDALVVLDICRCAVSVLQSCCT